MNTGTTSNWVLFRFQTYEEKYPVPWDIMYFRLALDCDFPIVDAVYRKTHTQVWTFGLKHLQDVFVYYKRRFCPRGKCAAIEGVDRFGLCKKRDVLHRQYGPAVEWADGRKEWWFNGERYYEGWPEWLKIFGNKNL